MTDAQGDLISVIVPVYNAEPYLRTCLDSIIRQSYSNIEVLLMASTSSDNSVDICHEYSKRDQRFKVVHDGPSGPSRARNQGIDRSSGKYICFIDSDDYVTPDFIGSLHSLCLEHRCEIAQCGFVNVGPKDDGTADDGSPEVRIFSGVEMCYNLYNDMVIASEVPWSKMYERRLFDGVRYPEGKLHEDVATTYLLLYKAERVAVTGRIMYHYRQHENSITGSRFNRKRLDIIQFQQERADFFRMKDEPLLHALALLSVSSTLVSHRHNVETYLPDSKDILREMKMKQLSTLGLVLINKNISLKLKFKTTVLALFYPSVVSVCSIYHSRDRPRP